MIYVLDTSDWQVYTFDNLESMEDFQYFMGGIFLQYDHYPTEPEIEEAKIEHYSY